MKLKETNKFIKRGIKLSKIIKEGSSGLFSYSLPTYDYKTVYDLDEAVNLTGDGWMIENIELLTANLVLNIYRDLKSG